MANTDDNFEDLKNCALTPDREQELLDAQRECVFSWTNKKGEAVGVIVSYFNHGGKIWMTCAEGRAREFQRLEDSREHQFALLVLEPDLALGKQLPTKVTALFTKTAKHLIGFIRLSQLIEELLPKA